MRRSKKINLNNSSDNKTSLKNKKLSKDGKSLKNNKKKYKKSSGSSHKYLTIKRIKIR